MKRAIALAVVALTLAGCHALRIPVCEEDAVLIGRGSFEHGQWTEYVCGPAVDDLPSPSQGKKRK